MYVCMYITVHLFVLCVCVYIHVYMYIQSDGTLVVARAMVLLECALFVNKLRNDDSGDGGGSQWMKNRQESHHRVSVHLKRWAEEIGEKLRIVELRERDKIQQLRGGKGGRRGRIHSVVLPEEPVLPDMQTEQDTKQRNGEGGKFQTVSFGIKMCACILLYEITHYLRDKASNTAATTLGTPRVSVTNLNGRRPSVISSTSTDTEAVATPSPSATGLHSLDSKTLASALRPHLSPDIRSSSLEEETVHGVHSPSLGGDSFDDEQSETSHKRVSVYLRVNSALEPASRRRVNSGLKQTVNVKAGAETNVPKKRRSSLSVSVGRRHVSFYEKQTSEQVGIRERPSAVTVSTLRPIPGKTTMKSSRSFQEAVPSQEVQSPSGSLRRPKLQSQGSTASQKNYNLGAQIQSGITRLARRAFRGKIHRKTTTSGPRKVSLPGSSPNLPLRKRPQRLSTAGPILLGIEDNKRYFKWLDIVEHLAIVDAFNPEAHSQHSRTCTELVTALNHVYARYEGGEDGSTVSSLNTLFSGLVDPFLQQRERYALEHARSNPLRRTGGKTRPPPPSSSFTTTQPLRSVSESNSIASSSISSTISFASLNFSQIKRSIFSSPSSNQCSVIEMFLESDSAQSSSLINSTFTNARRKYMQLSFAGLVHAPFSLLVYTAPIQSSSTFSSLKQVAWEMILDQDQHMAQTAGIYI